MYAAPAAQPAAGAQGPSAPLLQDKDDTMCLLPQCRRKKYREPDGTVHSFCGRTHAELTKNMNITGKAEKLTMSSSFANTL